jgi:hypothetical protein
MTFVDLEERLRSTKYVRKNYCAPPLFLCDREGYVVNRVSARLARCPRNAMLRTGGARIAGNPARQMTVPGTYSDLS